MYTLLKQWIFAAKNEKGDKDMKTLFFKEETNGNRWIDIETNDDGEFDVVLKTQAFAPDGGLYSDVSRDVLGFGFDSETAAEKCAEDMAAEYGF